jgi:UDP-N-acetylglucosamine acyltransferase
MSMTIHATAIVDRHARIDPTAKLGPYVVIDGPVTIGPECEIAASAVILGRTEIGARCRVHSHAVIGDFPQDRAFGGGDTSTRIGNDCVIREGVTVHRGTAAGTETVVGDRCMLMTNSHVAHNCRIDDDVTIISGALLAGYVQVGRRAVISGNAAIHQFVRIGELAMVGGLSKIVQDVPPYFMTDHEGNIVGENRIGLMRAGLSVLERKEVKAAYRIIYRLGLGHHEIVAHLSEQMTSDAGRKVLEFVSSNSKRGISRDTIRLRRAA